MHRPQKALNYCYVRKKTPDIAFKKTHTYTSKLLCTEYYGPFSSLVFFFTKLFTCCRAMLDWHFSSPTYNSNKFSAFCASREVEGYRVTWIVHWELTLKNAPAGGTTRMHLIKSRKVEELFLVLRCGVGDAGNFGVTFCCCVSHALPLYGGCCL